jgi:low affinity Fe/Cu permease
MRDLFRRIADWTALATGSSVTFFVALALSFVWLLVGPMFHYSDTWQLTMNTLASQVTFLIAFLLQNTQNRDTRAIQLKLDELIRSSESARSGLVQLESLSEEELDALEREFAALRRKSRPLPTAATHPRPRRLRIRKLR